MYLGTGLTYKQRVIGSSPILPTSPNLKRTPFTELVLGFFFAIFRLLPCRVTPSYCRCNAFRVFGGILINRAQTAVYAAKAA